MTRTPRAESGFVLPTAIFLLVVLAVLAAYMVSLSRTSHISSALDIQGTRAALAARAGIEWGAWQLLRNTSCAAGPTLLTGLGGTLAAFSVDVSCTQSGSYPDGADTVEVYVITSTAKSGASSGEVDYVERQIQASFSK